jgi:hypothetical protein
MSTFFFEALRGELMILLQRSRLYRALLAQPL